MSNVSSSNSQGVRVPKLRFRDNNGNAYPQYQHKTVGTLFTHISRRNADMTNNNVITNSAEFGLIPQREFFDKDIAVEGNTDKYYIIEQGDFVYNPRKSTTAPYGPFNCYQGKEAGIVSPLYTCLKPLHNEYTDYLLWYFRSSAWYSYIYHNGAQGGARHDRVGMTNELMDGIPVNLPSREEQAKVSRFLSVLEKRIEKQRQLVETLKLYKRGVIQRVFSGEITGVMANNNWGTVPISELFTNIIDKGHPEETVLTIVQGYGTIPRDSIERRISYDSSSVASYKKVINNDFILHLRSFEGGLEISNHEGIVSPAYTILRSKKTIDPAFFYAYFRSYEFVENKLRIAVEGIRDGKSINMDTFWKIHIPFPNLDVQQFYADLFSYFDRAIEKTNLILTGLENTKKYLLQQLFI